MRNQLVYEKPANGVVLNFEQKVATDRSTIRK